MIGIIYEDKKRMQIDLQSTSQLNNSDPIPVGDSRHVERDVNSIPYTYFIKHNEFEKWAIICDNTGKVETLLNKDSEQLTDDWFNNEIN